MNTIHLIIGASSQGKSTYIQNNFDPSIPILFAKDLSRQALPDSECIVHYNSLRLYDNDAKKYRPKLKPTVDEAINILLGHKERIRARILICPKNTILKRILTRNVTEPLDKAKARKYPNSEIYKLVHQLKLKKEYKKWIKFLNKHEIPFDIIDSTSKNFDKVANHEGHEIIKREVTNTYSKEEIEQILDNFRFEYQSIPLPYGLSTTGNNRFDSAAKILPEDLTGKTVLDIGSAYGYFCFEAEKRNSQKVVGTELKPYRYLGANIIKDIKQSEVEFLNKDILVDKPIDREFDIVLMLNVIHHLPFPIYSLHQASKYTKELLIIEFPTLDDKKFKKTHFSRIINSDMPYIGVSKLKEKDQTFVFSPSSLKRILVENNKYFSRIEFKDSPMSDDRKIAFCYK